jgi:hypothetical protein
MTIDFPDNMELWETVAAIQVMQSLGIGGRFPRFDGVVSDVVRLLVMAGVCKKEQMMPAMPLQTAEAYRAVNASTESYQAVLARRSGLDCRRMKAPQFPNAGIAPSLSGGIVICPFEINDAFKFPWQVWRAVIRHARTYGLPVTLLGRPGQRMDYATFTEGSILSELPMIDKMRALADSRLVLGIPNEWTWMATAWKKKVLVFYPDDLPVDRWFGFDVAPYTLGRVLYTRSQLQIPVMLAGARRTIELL